MSTFAPAKVATQLVRELNEWKLIYASSFFQFAFQAPSCFRGAKADNGIKLIGGHYPIPKPDTARAPFRSTLHVLTTFIVTVCPRVGRLSLQTWLECH